MRSTTARLPVVAAVAALAAACGAHSHPAATATGRAATPSPGAPGAAAAPARSAVPARTSAASQAAASPGAATSASPAAPDPPRSRTQRAGGASPLPAPGTYTYDVSGTATSPFGTKNLGGTTDLTVEPAHDGRQRSIDRASNGTTDQTVVARQGGIRLADLHISQQGFDEDFRAPSPVLLVPAHPRKGASWSWRIVSADGKYTMRTTVSVANPDGSATVSRRHLRTVVMTSHTVITGSQMHMTIDQRDEVARGVPVVREHSVVDGTAYGARFHADSTRRLRSTTPR